MSIVKDITRESWILGAFPEWGTWLNEEIDEEVVEAGKFKMWWIGNTGIWVKSENNTNICVDMWFGNGKRTQKVKEMKEYHQMRNMTGGVALQPNLRAKPITFDPFAMTNVDAILSTHIHGDHICPIFASAALKNVEKEVPFIGPQGCVDLWTSWGVPEERCIVMKPGDVQKIGDCEILALESFDRTILVTTNEDIKGICPTDEEMDSKALNYLIKTPAGSIYHSGDSHHSIYFAKHGKDYDIDVAFGSYGDNPIGNQDKMTSSDILRMAEALRCKVVIPFHYDLWTNFMADPVEIEMLYEFKKKTLQYEFTTFIWEVGGKFTFPDDVNKRRYHYRRGFEDCFTEEQNIPFKAML